MSDYENWNDEYQDDIESQGMPLIRQGQSNSPKVEWPDAGMAGYGVYTSTGRGGGATIRLDRLYHLNIYVCWHG